MLAISGASMLLHAWRISSSDCSDSTNTISAPAAAKARPRLSASSRPFPERESVRAMTRKSRCCGHRRRPLSSQPCPPGARRAGRGCVRTSSEIPDPRSGWLRRRPPRIRAPCGARSTIRRSRCPHRRSPARCTCAPPSRRGPACPCTWRAPRPESEIRSGQPESGRVHRIEPHALGEHRRHGVEHAGRDEEFAACQSVPEPTVRHGFPPPENPVFDPSLPGRRSPVPCECAAPPALVL